MGRQKTLWIDEACWEKLEQMGADPVSAKVRRCIMQHDTEVEHIMEGALNHIMALKRQVEVLKKALNEANVPGWWTE